ncbi:MAG TPA: hypothetical protein VF516_01050, partial [Kofleriaceae bacterium]
MKDALSALVIPVVGPGRKPGARRTHATVVRARVTWGDMTFRGRSIGRSILWALLGVGLGAAAAS